jgi:hypothetical protein
VAGNQPDAAPLARAHEQRLQDAVAGDRVTQRVQILLV